MAVAKVIEITSGSPDSFEDAIRRGLATAGRSLEGIRGAWVKEQSVKVREGEVYEWRVTLKVTFLLRGTDEDAANGRRSKSKRR
jgi:dodecin